MPPIAEVPGKEAELKLRGSLLVVLDLLLSVEVEVVVPRRIVELPLLVEADLLIETVQDQSQKELR